MESEFKTGLNKLIMLLVLFLALASSTLWAQSSDLADGRGNVPIPAASWGLLHNGLRNKFKWPLASDFLWNTAIGSGAIYKPAGIAWTNGTQFFEDEDIIVMTPKAPLTSVYYSGVGWSGGDRCKAQGGLLATVPLPTGYVVPNAGNNNSTAVLMPDGATVEQNQPFTRCLKGGSATTLVTFPDSSIYGPGAYGAHGGSGLSALGGTIRLGEFKSGAIHHPMKIEMWAKQYYFCCSPYWPATTVDGYANHITYGGTNPKLGPGSLLALPPNFDISLMTTIPGKILAQAFKDYGAYVVDDTAWNAWTLGTEQGPAGSVVNEFAKLYGFTMSGPAWNSPFMNDVTKIMQALQIVTNNSAKSVGGGGTPRVPAPPAIGN